MDARVDLLLALVLSVISAISVNLVHVYYLLGGGITVDEKPFLPSERSIGISIDSTDLKAKLDPGSSVINRFFGVLRL